MLLSMEPFSVGKWMMLLMENGEVIHEVLPDNIQILRRLKSPTSTNFIFIFTLT